MGSCAQQLPAYVLALFKPFNVVASRQHRSAGASVCLMEVKLPRCKIHCVMRGHDWLLFPDTNCCCLTWLQGEYKVLAQCKQTHLVQCHQPLHMILDDSDSIVGANQLETTFLSTGKAESRVVQFRRGCTSSYPNLHTLGAESPICRCHHKATSTHLQRWFTDTSWSPGMQQLAGLWSCPRW